MKKLVVNQDACISCGACVSIDSEHFDWDENGQSHAISQENLESAEITNAIESCPTGAISIEESENIEESNCEATEECNCENCECKDEGSEN